VNWRDDTGAKMEFLQGRPLSPEEPDQLREQIEHGFDQIEAVSSEGLRYRSAQLASSLGEASSRT
jgi:hypothetical protein